MTQGRELRRPSAVGGAAADRADPPGGARHVGGALIPVSKSRAEGHRAHRRHSGRTVHRLRSGPTQYRSPTRGRGGAPVLDGYQPGLPALPALPQGLFAESTDGAMTRGAGAGLFAESARSAPPAGAAAGARRWKPASPGESLAEFAESNGDAPGESADSGESWTWPGWLSSTSSTTGACRRSLSSVSSEASARVVPNPARATGRSRHDPRALEVHGVDSFLLWYHQDRHRS